MTSCTGSARAEDFVDFEQISRVETCLGRRRLAFASSQGLVMGAAQDGGGADEKARIERVRLSLLMSKNL